MKIIAKNIFVLHITVAKDTTNKLVLTI